MVTSQLAELIRESIHKRKSEIWERIDRVSILIGLRPLKVKQKVSGSFRNPDGKGADTFCQIHSVTQTAKKNDQNPFSAILAVANNY